MQICSHLWVEKSSNHKGSDAKLLKESPTESLPLHQRLKKDIITVTRRPTLLKTEQEYRSIITRSIDRASSLPVERKNYVQDYPPTEKERGYSMQRDQVCFDSLLMYSDYSFLSFMLEQYYIEIIVSGFGETLAWKWKMGNGGETWERDKQSRQTTGMGWMDRDISPRINITIVCNLATILVLERTMQICTCKAFDRLEILYKFICIVVLHCVFNIIGMYFDYTDWKNHWRTAE